MSTKNQSLEELRADIDVLEKRDEVDAEEVRVQHILVGVNHPRLPKVKRTPNQAEKLAAELLDKLREGESMSALMDEYSDDTSEGIYEMTNGATGSRAKMVKGFGDVAFRLNVGEVGVAKYDEKSCPFGYHIIARLS